MAPALLLVAASGLAREVLACLRTHAIAPVLGFLDDSPARQGTLVDGVPVLGPLEAVRDYPHAELLVCTGSGAAREQIVERLVALGVGPLRYATLVHPRVEVPAGCEVGAGSIVLAGVVLTADVTIGEHVVVMPNVTLTHDCVLQDYSTVCAGVALGGSVVVGHGAYVGMNASVRQTVHVGSYATLGMGAVLLTDQPDHETWVGVPARARGPRTAPTPDGAARTPHVQDSRPTGVPAATIEGGAVAR
ncbi:acetyltransferase [Cellulomonas soli]|uniref:acetyltransferase n=1 Tax=Cellulomonas soli TaxID=931535 RepID=UPI003F84547F